MRWVVTSQVTITAGPMSWSPFGLSTALGELGICASLTASEPTEQIVWGDNAVGVRPVVEIVVPYDPDTQQITGETVIMVNYIVTATPTIGDIPPDLAYYMNLLRTVRGGLIDDIYWRVERHQSQDAGGITPTDNDTKMAEIYTYLQTLRDFPEVHPDVDTKVKYAALVWPTVPI